MDIELLTKSNTASCCTRKIFREYYSLIRCPLRHSPRSLIILIIYKLLPLVAKSIIALFADDAYVYWSISSRKDADTLQKDLNNLGEWEKNWSMEFRPDKCQLLRITNKRKIVDAHYMIHGKRLKLVDSV